MAPVNHVTLAQNKTLARLFTCLVNEKFVKAYLIDAKAAQAFGIRGCIGTDEQWIVCVPKASHRVELIQGSFWIPLRATPMLSDTTVNNYDSVTLRTVVFLDPEELQPPIKQLSGSEHHVFEDVREVRTVTEQLKKWYPTLKESVVEQSTLEMENSVANQAAAFENWYGDGPTRTFPSLEESHAVEWEQSIVEGHATHPMNKARSVVPPTLPICSEEALKEPKLHFFAVPRSQVTIRGNFERLLSPLVPETDVDPAVEAVVPVHEVQLPNIIHYFPFARELPFTRKARAQVSTRTVTLEELPEFNLKLPIGVKITSAMRTITPWSTHVGPAFNPVAEQVIQDGELLVLCREVASIVSNNPNPDIAKHLSCIIREDAQHLVTGRGERVVVCAALTERASIEEDENKFVVNLAFSLNTPEEKTRFFKRYANLFLSAFVPPLLKGFTFEAHLQNVLARFARSRDGWELVGFAVRDLGGIKVHQETLYETTGVRLDVWDPKDCAQLAHDIEDVHKVAYHTMVVCHLHRFARALGVHHNGVGWQLVKQELDTLLPQDCHTRRLWLESSTANWKAFIRMKLEGLYRDYLYTEVPNLITYAPA